MMTTEYGAGQAKALPGLQQRAPPVSPEHFPESCDLEGPRSSLFAPNSAISVRTTSYVRLREVVQLIKSHQLWNYIRPGFGSSSVETINLRSILFAFVVHVIE